jgi:hypothetical protein
MIRIPSRATCIIAGGAAGLLIVAVLIFQKMNRSMQQDVETGAFEKQYASAIQSLDDAIHSAQHKIEGNAAGSVQPDQLKPIQKKPVIATVTNDLEIKLQGISWNSEVPVAMVNGKIYRVGEVIGEFTLVRITADTLFLENGQGESKKIQLAEDAL